MPHHSPLSQSRFWQASANNSQDSPCVNPAISKPDCKPYDDKKKMMIQGSYHPTVDPERIINETMDDPSQISPEEVGIVCTEDTADACAPVQETHHEQGAEESKRLKPYLNLNNQKLGAPGSSSTPATTPEPHQQQPQSISSGSSILSSWYSLASNSSYEPIGYDSKVYKSFVGAIDKCLKNFEYSIEWPDLISALTKLNKVIQSFNQTLQPPPQNAPQPSTPQPQVSPPMLPRHLLITKRLSQCLHPNLPSGVHLKTLETFDLIFQGFKYHDYANLEQELFSFISGLLPLWSYAAISVKPKLLSIYETHLASLPNLSPALGGIMLSLFNGLVDDGVDQDIKIRITCLLQTLQSQNEKPYFSTLNSLVEAHPSIHLPAITHMMQISYSPPPSILTHLINSPNTLVQRNALEMLKSYDLDQLPQVTQMELTRTALQSLLKRDMSVTRRVFTFVEPRQDLAIQAISSLISECIDGLSLTRILSTLLDNPNITILPTILAPVVKYLMKCEYTISVSFLSTISSTFLCNHFTTFLFEYENLEDLESRTIVFNYVVKLRLFEFDYNTLFAKLRDLDDVHVRVILQVVRLHYTEHQDSFVRFYNAYMARYYDLRDYDNLKVYRHENSCISETPTKPPNLHTSFTCSSFEFICDLIQKSNPDEMAFKYVIVSSCINSAYTGSCIRVFIRFQEQLASLVYNTHAVYLIFKHCYDNDKALLNKLKYPEKYLLSELHSDDQLRSVIELDLSSSPLVVLKLVDPVTMGNPYRKFISNMFVSSHSNLVLQSILKYLEFHVDNKPLYSRAKSESNLTCDDEDEHAFKHATSVVNVTGENEAASSNVCSYDSARILTLLEKLEFVMSVNDKFLESIDLIVLLSKLTVLSTISNSNEKEPHVTLTIQTRALNCIREITRSHGDLSHSFVYDSLLSHLNTQEGAPTQSSLLWELSAITVIREFLKFDLENYTLALVIQRSLNGNCPDNPMKELHEQVHVRWLDAIATNLTHIRKHLNAVVLITYTSSCRNVLELECSENYNHECVRYVSTLLRNVLNVKYTEQSSSGNSGFFGSIFGSTAVKHELVDEREALRIALLGKLDLLIKIGCKSNRIVRLYELLELLRYVTDNYESHVLQSISKCFDCASIELVVKELKIPSTKVASCITQERVIECISFLCKYLRHDKTMDVQSIVLLSKQCVSCRHTLQLVTEYLKNTSNGKVSKEIQDLVVRTIELAVEKREFAVLETFVPAIFDLVWGEIGTTAGGTEETDRSVGASASSASVRDQKIIVNLVHGIVVAVLVAVKGSTDSSQSGGPTPYASALRVLEQISHHSYLRKSWKKEIFDLITNEPTFFYFTPECLAIWKVIVDNLFTQDRSTFSELITRLTQTTQMSTSALSNIFSSKDSEVYETRASLLKRLAFVLHSSEKDQYAKYITNIQEKIAEALKIGGAGGGGMFSEKPNVLVPGVNNSVFLCFRVMVLKFNCNILVSLWPIIVHEVVMVLNNLSLFLEDYATSSPSVPPPSPLLSLYLQTLKLLNSLFTIPSSDSQIPHFQLYKWAFTESSQEHNNNVNMFVPYVTKLRSTASAIFPGIRFNTPPLRVKSVSTVEELCSAFGCLDEHVPECESEIIDFCDGGSGGGGAGRFEDGNTTDL